MLRQVPAPLASVHPAQQTVAMKLLFLPVVIVVGCSLTSFAADPLRDEVERSLRINILEVWFPRIIDKENGGFLCDFNADWKPAGQQLKTNVYQARALWTASQAARRYPSDARYADAARHGFKFLQQNMWDSERGGW